MTALSPERIAGTFCAHPSLTERERPELEHQGVPAQVLERVRAGYVVRCGPDAFEFEQHTDCGKPHRAFLFLVSDLQGAPADVVAWMPAADWVGTWRGLAWALGQETVYRPRLDYHGALWVHPDPLEWLKHKGRGIVLLRSHLAAAFLCDAGPLLVDNAEFGAQLRASLTRHPPEILVATAREPSRRADVHCESLSS